MSNKKPMVLVIAGPNGSGKSTISEYFDKVGEYTNADEYVVSTGVSNEEAAKIVDKKRYEAIENREDFSFETHHVKEVLDLLVVRPKTTERNVHSTGARKTKNAKFRAKVRFFCFVAMSKCDEVLTGVVNGCIIMSKCDKKEAEKWI